MAVLLGLIGLAVGVVVNSLADDLPPDELGLRHAPRLPRCRYCGAAHRPGYWLALSAFLLRGGRCEHCHAPRRVRPAVVELATALALAGVWSWAGGRFDRFFSAAVIVVIFILIVVIDVEHRLILWIVVFPSAVIIALLNGLAPERGPLKTLAGGAAGYAVWLMMFLFAQVFSRAVARLRGQPLDEIAFGGGDVNLGGVVGLAVGWPGVALTVPITIFTAAAFSLAYVLVQLLRRRYTLFTPFPYGPFLALGALVIYFFGKDFAAWYLGR